MRLNVYAYQIYDHTGYHHTNGIVIAQHKAEASQKIWRAYMKHGDYSPENDLLFIRESCCACFDDCSDVIEVDGFILER